MLGFLLNLPLLLAVITDVHTVVADRHPIHDDRPPIRDDRPTIPNPDMSVPNRPPIQPQPGKPHKSELKWQCRNIHGNAYFSYYYTHHSHAQEKKPNLLRFMKDLVECGQNNTELAIREVVLVVWSRLGHIERCFRQQPNPEIDIDEYGRQLADHFIQMQREKLPQASMLLESMNFHHFYKNMLHECLAPEPCCHTNSSSSTRTPSHCQFDLRNISKVFSQTELLYHKKSRLPDIPTANKYITLAQANRMMCVYEEDLHKPAVPSRETLTTVVKYILLGYDFKHNGESCPVTLVRDMFRTYANSTDLVLSEQELKTLMKRLNLTKANTEEHPVGHSRTLHNRASTADKSGLLDDMDELGGDDTATAEEITTEVELTLPQSTAYHTERNEQLEHRGQLERSQHATRVPHHHVDNNVGNHHSNSVGDHHGPNVNGHANNNIDSHHIDSYHGNDELSQLYYVDPVDFTNGYQNVTCLSPWEVLRVVGQQHTHDIDLQTFFDICPVLLQQTLTKSCRSQGHEVKAKPISIGHGQALNSTNTNSTSAEMEVAKDRSKEYLYGSLSILVISACSLLGAVFMKISGSKLKHYIMGSMLALAVGCLIADAVLHLLPEISALDRKEESSDDNLLPDNLKKLCSMLASIYAFFLLELYLSRKGQGHSHGQFENPPDKTVVVKNVDGEGDLIKETNLGPSSARLNTTNYINNQLRQTNSSDSSNTQQIRKLDNIVASTSDHTIELSRAELNTADQTYDVRAEYSLNNSVTRSGSDVTVDQSADVKAKKAVAWMIIIGDGIHNFADGLAVGAAFSLSFTKGLSTSITIFCHELPHELGDFAVLVSTGMSVKRAMLFNFVSSLTAFAGLYVGLVLGDQPEASKWIFAIGAGMFLYVAMTDLIPECKEYFKRFPDWKMFLGQNLGILVGYTGMLLLAMFEDEMEIEF